jgi:HEAT repeat protein
VTFTAGTLLGFLALFSSPQDDKAFQSAIKKFQEDYYKVGAKDDEKIAAVNYLAQHHHEKIVKVLAPLLIEGSLPVRIMIARSLAQFAGIDAAARELLSGLQAQANSGKKQGAVRIEILRALGALRYKPAAPEVGKLVGDKEVWVAKAAIDASSRIRFQEAIPLLIKALSRIEGKEGDSEVTANPLEGIVEGVDAGSLFKPDPRQPKRPSERELLKGPIQGALQSITKQSFASAKEWESWWAKNKATFKVSD